MEIVLARHGRPNLVRTGWVIPRQLADWIVAYNDAGVFAEEAPSDLRAKADSCWIVSSPLLRCVRSAEALAPSRKITSEELFREVGLPHTLWRFPRLPVSVWTVIFRVAWFCGYSTNSESLSMARDRARTAAARLTELAREHESVFFMGHGIMTALIARELVLRGWVGPKRPAHGYWGFSVYRDTRLGS
jgi:broad specificity phosphatase PhoE